MPTDASGQLIRQVGANSGPRAWRDSLGEEPLITTDEHDEHDQDMANAINGSIDREGKRAARADISLGGHKAINVAAGTARADASTYGQLLELLHYVDPTNVSGDASTTTLIAPLLLDYKLGIILTWQVKVAPTSPHSLRLNTRSTKLLCLSNNDPISSNELPVGSVAAAIYNGDCFYLVGPVPSQYFDLHEDVTDEATVLSLDDRMVLSNEGDTGHPNNYATLRALRAFFLTKNAGLATRSTVFVSSSFSDIATVTIIPRLTTSFIRLRALIALNDGSTCDFRIQRGGQTVHHQNSYRQLGGEGAWTLGIYDNPGVTTPVTYVLQIRGGRAQPGSFLLAEEVKGSLQTRATDLALGVAFTEVLTVSYTPGSVGEIVQVRFWPLFSKVAGVDDRYSDYQLLRGPTIVLGPIHSQAVSNPETERGGPIVEWFDKPNTIEAVTYSIRAKAHQTIIESDSYLYPNAYGG